MHQTPDQNKIQSIDLKKIFESKNPKLLKLLPSFVLRYMKRILHEKEFNEFLQLSKNDYGHDFVKAAIRNFEIEVCSTGLENIPKDGGCIIACNHPLGGIDGIAVMSEVGKVRKDIKALVNDILMNIINLKSLLIPINKFGKNAVECVKCIDRAYASEECIIVFPAGLVSRFQDGKIIDQEWKKSFIAKAVKYKHNIVPVYVEGRFSNFFYILTFLRKKIGIKSHIERFYMVDEVYKQKGKSINIIFGFPIPYTVFSNEHSDQYWAEKVKEHVYSLKDAKKWRTI